MPDVPPASPPSGAPGASPPTPAQLKALLTQLLALLEGLPSNPKALDALKKPGAWRNQPLISTSPEVPIYVQLPAAIQFVNVPPAVLAATIANTPVATDARGNAMITIRPLLG